VPDIHTLRHRREMRPAPPVFPPCTVDRQDEDVPGQRDACVAILKDGVSGCPDAGATSSRRIRGTPTPSGSRKCGRAREKHRASLSLPSVQRRIAKGRPDDRRFGERFETQPGRRARPGLTAGHRACTPVPDCPTTCARMGLASGDHGTWCTPRSRHRCRRRRSA
jgi:hypothetical protein